MSQMRQSPILLTYAPALFSPIDMLTDTAPDMHTEEGCRVAAVELRLDGHLSVQAL